MSSATTKQITNIFRKVSIATPAQMEISEHVGSANGV